MASIIKKLDELKKISPPHFVPNNVQYETIVGSEAYGCGTNFSDKDIYAFCIPPKEVVFPHLQGEIPGFGRQIQRFGQFQEHHVKHDNGVEYDIVCYNIVKYFQLCMENNPNMIDSLFTRQVHVLYETPVATMVRENRKIFLHKGCWHKFKGYAYKQLGFAKTKVPKKDSKRYASFQKYGYDVKFAYHIVRLINEVEQILTEHDLDLIRNNRQIISIRNGEWTLDEVETWFKDKELALEQIYLDSTLPYKPDEPKIKQLLLNCLEEFYGSIDDAISSVDKYKQALIEIDNITRRYLRVQSGVTVDGENRV